MRLLAFPRSLRPGLLLAVVTFVLGVAAGALLGPDWGARPFLTNPARAPASPPATSRAGQPADVLRVYDGDTFEAQVHVWPGIDITTKVRLRGIDAPELRAKCPEERTRAEAAREALRTLLAEGDVMVMRVGLDKYGGRVLAEAGTRATSDVAAVLLARGLVRPYSDGRREPWCDGIVTGSFRDVPRD